MKQKIIKNTHFRPIKANPSCPHKPVELRQTHPNCLTVAGAPREGKGRVAAPAQQVNPHLPTAARAASFVQEFDITRWLD